MKFMPKISYLELQIHSKNKLEPTSAKKLLQFISNYENGLMKPEKYDYKEPAKLEFNPNDLSTLIKWMSNESCWIFLKSIKKVRYHGYIKDYRGSNNLIDGNLTPRSVLTEVIFWIDSNIIKKKSVDFIKNFFKELFLILDSEFGFLTLKQDYDNKNHLVEKLDDNGTRETYLGQKLEIEGIAGLYWINIFGKNYVDWFGKGKFDKIRCWKKEELNNGSILLQFCERPEECLSDTVLEQQKNVKKTLGEDTFFDLKQPNRKVKIPKFLRGSI